MFLVLRRACDAIKCMEWTFFSFAALNLPTCHWLGCSRALKPRRSGSSAALVDELGIDSQKTRDLRLPLIIERSVRDTPSRARDQQRHKRGQMAPSAVLREEPRSGSLARGRPQFIVAVKPTLTKEAFVPSGLLICGGNHDGHIPHILLPFG